MAPEQPDGTVDGACHGNRRHENLGDLGTAGSGQFGPKRRSGRITWTNYPPHPIRSRGFVELSVKGSLLRRPARCRSGPLEKHQNVVVVEINAEDASVFVEPIKTAE